MMKIFLMLIMVVSCACAKADSNSNNKSGIDAEKGEESARAAMKSKDADKDNPYFSCWLPSDWRKKITKRKGSDCEKLKSEELDDYDAMLLKEICENDMAREKFLIELLGPAGKKVPTIIYLSYSGNGGKFDDYKDFMEANSKSLIKTDKYAPVKKITVAGRKAFYIGRESRRYLDLNGKSEETAAIKESLFVLPGKDGFYVLHYYALKSDFPKHLKTFNRITETFKVRNF